MMVQFSVEGQQAILGLGWMRNALALPSLMDILQNENEFSDLRDLALSTIGIIAINALPAEYETRFYALVTDFLYNDEGCSPSILLLLNTLQTPQATEIVNRSETQQKESPPDERIFR
jgi:hypothetical protein